MLDQDLFSQMVNVIRFYVPGCLHFVVLVVVMDISFQSCEHGCQDRRSYLELERGFKIVNHKILSGIVRSYL